MLDSYLNLYTEYEVSYNHWVRMPYGEMGFYPCPGLYPKHLPDYEDVITLPACYKDLILYAIDNKLDCIVTIWDDCVYNGNSVRLADLAQHKKYNRNRNGFI
jgi:hypothetical protein